MLWHKDLPALNLHELPNQFPCRADIIGTDATKPLAVASASALRSSNSSCL